MPLLKSLLINNIIQIHIWKIDETLFNLKKLVSLGETGFIPNIVLIKPDGSMVSNDRAEVLKKLEKFTSS